LKCFFIPLAKRHWDVSSVSVLALPKSKLGCCPRFTPSGTDL